MRRRTRSERAPARRRRQSRWERDLGLAPGEGCAESYVAYFDDRDDSDFDGTLDKAFGLHGRGTLVNAVITDRGRLVLRTPDGAVGPTSFDAKRPAQVEVLGPDALRLAGARGGAEPTKVVSVRTPGGASARIIVAESAVEALLRWCSERPQLHIA